MNLLHRHLFFSVLATCAAAIGLFGFVLIVGNALKDLLGYLLAGQLQPDTVLKLLLLLAPYVCSYALPMGMVTGVLLVLGRMSSQNEITAMRAAGLGLGYIARPIFLIAGLGVVAALFVNFEYMPRARSAYKATLAAAVRDNPLGFVVPKTFVRDFPGVVFYVSAKDGPELRDVWVWRLDKEQRAIEFLRAGSGQVDYDAGANRMTLRLKNAQVDRRNEKDPENFANTDLQATFGDLSFDLPLDKLFGRQTLRIKPSWMTYRELVAERARVETAPELSVEERAAKLGKLSFTLHEKASSAVAVLAFAFIAVPLGIKVSRQETSANLGVALALVMTYYFLTVMVGWLERWPQWRPDLLLWVPTLLFLAVGIRLFRSVGRV